MTATQYFFQKNQFIILVIDDFHAIHTVHDPKVSKTSTAVHMATELVDVHEIAAIGRPAGIQVHQTVKVGIKDCRGGIHIESVKKLFSEYEESLHTFYYQQTLPPDFLEFYMANAIKSVEHLRYSFFVFFFTQNDMIYL